MLSQNKNIFHSNLCRKLNTLIQMFSSDDEHLVIKALESGESKLFLRKIKFKIFVSKISYFLTIIECHKYSSVAKF